jgi:hypothetical protein
VKVHTTGQDDYGQHLRLLVAGQPGAGKTRFSATAPNPLFANARGGLMSIADRGVRYVNIGSEAEMLQMKLMLDGFGMSVEEHFHGPVDTLVIDTLDEFQRILMTERLASQKRAETTAGDWGWLSQRMHTIVEGLCKLPMHIIFVTHLKEVTDGVTGQLFFKPSLQGSFCEQVSQYMDMALLITARHYSTGGPELIEEMGRDPYMSEDTAVHFDSRTMITYPSAMYEWVKDLSGVLPPEMELDFQNDFGTLHELVSAKAESLPESLIFEDDSAEVQADEALNTTGVPVDTYIAGLTDRAKQFGAEAAPVVAEALSETETPVEEATGTACADCGKAVENQDRIDLAMIRYRTPLCAGCFDSRRNS